MRMVSFKKYKFLGSNAIFRIICIVGFHIFLLMIICSLSYSQRLVRLNLDSLESFAKSTLEKDLTDFEDWDKVHVGEFIAWTYNDEEVLSQFKGLNKVTRNEKELRIGVWRVLALTDKSLIRGRNKWVNKILRVYSDEQAPDRIHAIETLGKLKVSPLEKFPLISLESLLNKDYRLSFYTRWSLCYSSPGLLSAGKDWFINFLLKSKDNIDEVKLALFILGRLGKLPINDWESFADRSLKMTNSSPLKIDYLKMCFLTAPQSLINTDDFFKIRDFLLNEFRNRNNQEKMEILDAFAQFRSLDKLVYLKTIIDKECGSLPTLTWKRFESIICYGILNTLKIRQPEAKDTSILRW